MTSRRARYLAALFLIAIATAMPLTAADAPTAQQTLQQAEATAAAQHKNLLVSFGASWCQPCHLFASMMADSTVGPALANSFVEVSFSSGETGRDPKHVNDLGAKELQESLGGKGSGYPYIVMLTPEGKPIVDSLRPAGHGKAENIGFPVDPKEIDWFMEMLKRGAPGMSPAETAEVRAWLAAVAKKLKR